VRMPTCGVDDARKSLRYRRLTFDCAPPSTHASITRHRQREVITDSNRTRELQVRGDRALPLCVTTPAADATRLSQRDGVGVARSNLPNDAEIGGNRRLTRGVPSPSDRSSICAGLLSAAGVASWP
jgi:hypothetical protein